MKYKSLAKLGMYNKKNVKHKLFGLLNKIMVCTIILLVSLIVIKSNPEVREYVNEKVFNNNFSFAYIKNLYNKYFGDVLPKSNEDIVSVFSEQIQYEELNKYHDGYELKVATNYLTPVVESGIIVFIGEKDNYGKIIIVEQIDGKNIWYGNINSSYKLYDYVTKGKFLGEVIDNKLYLVGEKDGEYLDIENILS